MIQTPVQFEANGQTYTACYVGDRDGKPANRWYCHAIGLYIDAPGNAVAAVIIAAFADALNQPSEEEE